jgi:hypothetical protein
VVLPFRLDQLFAHLAAADCKAGEVEDEISAPVDASSASARCVGA